MRTPNENWVFYCIIPLTREGIGKTAIMEQIAQELNVGLVSYSMTHHTRQSALGLPFIEKRNFGGKKYNVSEYTMSEIIASVYDMMEETKMNEGILFLDEINCVSETLAPAMLQFLQYKIFGKHTVPKGWIIVTAGNPPEYNNSVREFDIVTWDRLKRIDIEPEFESWKEYAYKKQVHPSIITYLEIKKSDFYSIETTVDGKSFITARGWSDLSDMIKLYEQHKMKIDQMLTEQYIQNKKIAKNFSIYYDLFNKYKSDYQVNKILDGTIDASIKERAKSAKFDERLSLLGLIIDAITAETKLILNLDNTISKLAIDLKYIKSDLNTNNFNLNEIINTRIELHKNNIKLGNSSSSMSSEEQYIINCAINELEKLKNLITDNSLQDGCEIFKIIKKEFDKLTKKLLKDSNNTSIKLSNIFKFCEEVFKDGQELLIFITELTMNYYTSEFISQYGCDEYFIHNKELMFYERQKSIIQEIELLNL